MRPLCGRRYLCLWQIFLFVLFFGGTYSIREARAVEICACNGHGGVEGVSLWGPKDEFCGGIAGWGKYQNCREVDQIAACVGKSGPPSDVEGVVFWGPKGEPCAGKANWGVYEAQVVNTAENRICMCQGLGGVNGVKLWGPEGFFCGGMSNSAWGLYDVSCR